MSTDHAEAGQREASKIAGDRAEANVVAAVDDLASVSDTEAEHYDAEAIHAIGPSDELPFAGIAVLERGVPVEIKTCIPELSSGQRGRFYLRFQQHDQLVEDGGAYLFAVTTPHDRDVLAMKVVPARQVADVVPSWRDAGDDRPKCAQLTWSNVFRFDEIPRDMPTASTGVKGP